MKTKNTLDKFRKNEIKNKKDIKGGRRASNIPGGSSGSGFIDWGDIEIRNDFESITVKTDGQLGVYFGG